MRYPRPVFGRRTARLHSDALAARPPIVQINNATFYRQHPSSAPPAGQDAPSNPALFPNLTFSIPSFASPNQHWSILSPSSSARTTFLQVLRGQHICIPPTARSFPYLASDEIASKDPRLRNHATAIQYVGFDAERGGLGGTSTQGAYLSARYESRREETDFSLLDYLLGNTELNPDENLQTHPAGGLLDQVVADLRLENLMKMPVSSLSNGQTRRARIAKALLGQPEVLLLDGPFMGLDPPTLKLLSSLLHRLAEASAPRLLLSLRPDDSIPDWITHLLYVGEDFKVSSQGPKREVFRYIQEQCKAIQSLPKGSFTDPGWISIREVARHLESGGVFHRLDESDDTPLIKNESAEGKRGRPKKQATHVVKKDIKRSNPLRYAAGKDGTLDVSRLTPEDLRRYNSAKIRYDAGSRTDGVLRPLGLIPLREAITLSRDGYTIDEEAAIPPGEPLVEMNGVKVAYGDRTVLGDWQQDVDGTPRDGLWWTLRRGQRWGVFGPNGSGKTTLLSLITSDHPQTYSAPIRLFGRSRLPSPGQPGISLFDVQFRIGHSSPEVHAFFPRSLTLRRTIESAWADAPLSKPNLTHSADQKVDAVLRWFRGELNPSLGMTALERAEITRPTSEFRGRIAQEGTGMHSVLADVLKQLEAEDADPFALDWADQMRFGELSFSAQRVALFLRAVIRNPDLVILDEAFSGMDDMARDKCMLFLTRGESMILRYITQLKVPREAGPRVMESDISRLGRVRVPGLSENQALLVVSHNKEEVPGCVREWMCLPEPGMGAPRFGRLGGPLELDSVPRWREIWGMDV